MSTCIYEKLTYTSGADPGFSERGVEYRGDLSEAGGLGGTAPQKLWGFLVI